MKASRIDGRASDFRVGQRVRLTQYAKAEGIRLQARASDRGTVTRIGPSPLSIEVRPDNYKGARSYYVGFWEPMTLARKR